MEEALSLQQQLDSAKAAARSSVDKAVARSWIVNFVECEASDARRDELLLLMAEWWDFAEADLLRLGMLDTAPPRPDLPPDASLSDAFANFLDREVEVMSQRDGPAGRPSVVRPDLQRPVLARAASEGGGATAGGAGSPSRAGRASM